MNKAILMLAAVFALSVGAQAQAQNPKATPTPAGATDMSTPDTGKTKSYKKHHTRHHKKSSKTEAQ
jgi:hypothetical protein